MIYHKIQDSLSELRAEFSIQKIFVAACFASLKDCTLPFGNTVAKMYCTYYKDEKIWRLC